MKKELITEESVEALVKDLDEDDRKSLSFYTHLMMKAFANKDNVKVAIVFDTEDASGVAAINMTTAEVMFALESCHANLYKVITKDMPPKEMLN
jgi:hydroxymethylglutaryl-CoA reductase